MSNFHGEVQFDYESNFCRPVFETRFPFNDYQYTINFKCLVILIQYCYDLKDKPKHFNAKNIFVFLSTNQITNNIIPANKNKK